MRISDWSSDVCSSDLYSWPEAAFDAVVAIFVQFADPLLRASMFSGFIRTLRPGGILLLEGYRPEQLRFGTGGPKVEENQIGRASRRDRVCQYVSNSVVAVSFNNKKIEAHRTHG